MNLGGYQAERWPYPRAWPYTDHPGAVRFLLVGTCELCGGESIVAVFMPKHETQDAHYPERLRARVRVAVARLDAAKARPCRGCGGLHRWERGP